MSNDFTCKKHNDCNATRTNVRRWMRLNAKRFIDRETGELNCTELCEAAAYNYGHDEWLDDHTHEIWDFATEIDGSNL